MPFITMQDRGQLTIPGEICKVLALKPGAILEAHTENGKIILETKNVINRTNTTLDKMLADSLEQADRGETVGPFESTDEWSKYVDSIENKK